MPPAISFFLRLLSSLVLISALGLPAGAEITVSGHVLARVQGAEAPTSWRDGGFGRLALGDRAGASTTDPSGQIHLVLDGHWLLGDSELGATLHTTARVEPDAVGGRAIGVVEAYATFVRDLGERDRLMVRLGHFLLGTSLENIEPAWASPFTSTFSAINTWIGEEVRPTGIEIGLDHAVGSIDSLRVTAAAFGGDDTAGTLLAWRGWSLGDRLSVFGERLPLPPLPGLADGAGFGAQRNDGTQPFGDDLDGRVGWAASLGWQRPESASVRITAYDNRGDRELHGSPGEQEYAWDTDFVVVAAEIHRGPWSFATEWMTGSTGMGEVAGPQVQADFEAIYGLASWAADDWRLTVRYDDFETVDRDGSSAYDPNDGSGQAWLTALLWEPSERPLRVVLEWLDVDAQRPVAARVGETTAVGGTTWTLEARLFLDGLVGTD